MDALLLASRKYPKPDNFIPSYGTAGFRANASLLNSTMFRCGIIIAARAIITKKTTGAVCTASHNISSDNGIKLVDPSGDMLDPKWETYANSICQAETEEEISNIVKTLVPCFPKQCASNKVVLIGHDTRESCDDLVKILVEGIKTLGVKANVIGMMTTPQLHFYVHNANKYSHIAMNVLFPQLYFTTVENSFDVLFKRGTPKTVHVDCANGVGYHTLLKFIPKLESLGLHVDMRNTGHGKLNFNCGADYVQKEGKFPDNFENIPENSYCCSLDGDADRLVYFTKINGKFVLLNGDRLACLYGIYLKFLIMNIENFPEYTMGIVQTAYANGSSTSFMELGMKCEVKHTPTGVKYLHNIAKEYDIGIYFESNGHGTILFDPEFIKKVEELDDDNYHVIKFLAVANLMNQNVGDGISNLLLAETVFTTGYAIDEWIQLYKELPCCQMQVHVQDKNKIKTTYDEKKCVEPIGLQDAIDKVVRKYKRARAFVRPSGTEDAVRVYSEAESEEDVYKLGHEIADLLPLFV